MKETVEENTSTTERVFQDRQYQVKFFFFFFQPSIILSNIPEEITVLKEPAD